MRTDNPARPHVATYDVSRFDVLQFSRCGIALPIRGWLGMMAIGPYSGDDGEYDFSLGNWFAVLKALRQNAKRKRLGFSHGLLSRLAVAHDAGKLRNFGDPATVYFLFNLNCEHNGYSTDWIVNFLKNAANIAPRNALASGNGLFSPAKPSQ
jgi:hypothetical protein